MILTMHGKSGRKYPASTQNYYQKAFDAAAPYNYQHEDDRNETEGDGQRRISQDR